MTNLYSPTLLDHFRHPRHVGELPAATHRAKEVNTSCGDTIVVQLTVRQGQIKQIKHQTAGCAVAVACASMLSEKLLGKRRAAVQKISPTELLSLLSLSLPPSRVPCALLPLSAIQKALGSKGD